MAFWESKKAKSRRRAYKIKKKKVKARGKTSKIRAKGRAKRGKIKARKSAKIARIGQRGEKAALKAEAGYWDPESVEARQSAMWGGLASLGGSAAEVAGAAIAAGDLGYESWSPTGGGEPPPEPDEKEEGLPDWAIPAGIAGVGLLAVMMMSGKKAA